MEQSWRALLCAGDAVRLLPFAVPEIAAESIDDWRRIWKSPQTGTTLGSGRCCASLVNSGFRKKLVGLQGLVS